MWYLTVPPIIVVVSLLLVLWYLSRRGADPVIAEKVSQGEREALKKASFFRTKSFFLRVLEKTAQRFKVQSLRMHNTLHVWTQSLKERRRLFQEKTSPMPPVDAKEEYSISQEIASFSAPVVSEKKEIAHRGNLLRRFFGKETVVKDEVQASLTNIKEERVFDGEKKSQEQERIITFEQPLVRRRKEETIRESILEPRPTVSDKVARPESVKKNLFKRETRAREEDFIARIAVNPKDFTAYEGLGDYYLEIGNVKDAKECYRQVLKLSPVHRMVKIKIRRLEKILSQKSDDESLENERIIG
ncbi:MAG: tetratricopeptide repeat protein [Candidatus Moranbacteria bacterium]|nr:tetratricopeptide repeat protein [Candidatus Moranbacteria bacterium]